MAEDDDGLVLCSEERAREGDIVDGNAQALAACGYRRLVFGGDGRAGAGGGESAEQEEGTEGRERTASSRCLHDTGIMAKHAQRSQGTLRSIFVVVGAFVLGVGRGRATTPGAEAWRL